MNDEHGYSTEPKWEKMSPSSFYLSSESAKQAFNRDATKRIEKLRVLGMLPGQDLFRKFFKTQGHMTMFIPAITSETKDCVFLVELGYPEWDKLKYYYHLNLHDREKVGFQFPLSCKIWQSQPFEYVGSEQGLNVRVSDDYSLVFTIGETEHRFLL